MTKNAIAILVAVLTLGYFLPAAIATCRDHKNTTAIWVLNGLTGWWFGAGWVVSMVWAFTN